MLYRTSIGLDVHARSIAATAFIQTREIVQKAFPYDAGKVAEWARACPSPQDASTSPAPRAST